MDGQAVRRQWRTSSSCAARLAALAGAWGFEGWLVNIESDCPSFRHARDFVHELSLACRPELGERAVVIYYDSLGSSGRVGYQNGLAQHSAAMLDCCDGLLTNYWWSRSLSPPRVGAARLAETPERRRRVFFGVDIFARGSVYRGHTPGPGAGVAVAAARARGFSVAVLAPGWSYENGGARVPDALLPGLGSARPEARAAAALERARELDSAFWSALVDSPYRPSACEELQDGLGDLFGTRCGSR
jgi:endo-beta-N-acetylglucosaminidase D